MTSVNTNRYILLKSILSNVQKVPSVRKNEALFVWVDVNCYFPPTLLSHFISVLRSTPYVPSSDNIVLLCNKYYRIEYLYRPNHQRFQV